jgi:SnoaL-like domain
MSQGDLDLTLSLYRFFNSRELDALVALTHEDIVIESRLVAMEGGYKGHEGVRRWWTNLLDAFPDYRAEVEELRDLGVVTVGRFRGTGHAADSDTPVVDVFWQALRWRDGVCVWWRNGTTEADVLEGVELPA